MHSFIRFNNHGFEFRAFCVVNKHYHDALLNVGLVISQVIKLTDVEHFSDTPALLQMLS